MCSRHGVALIAEEAFRAGDGDALLGLVLGGRFALDCRLGAGSTGIVYGARDAEVGDRVAVKVFRPWGPDVDARRIRFEAMRRAIERLDGQTTAALRGAGDLLDPADDVIPQKGLFVAMELVTGPSLSLCLSAGRLEQRVALQVADGVLGALARAHERGVLHGDLKPEHVAFVGSAPGPDVRLLDFAMHGADDPGAAGLGTPLYMAPERVRGEPLSPATDVYAAGALLFHMLVGAPPFGGRDARAVMDAHRFQPVPSACAVAPGAHISEPISTLVGAALAKRPGERPATAEAFRSALAELARRLPSESPNSALAGP